MPTVVLKLSAGQGTETDGQTKRRLYASLFGGRKKTPTNLWNKF